MTTEITLSSVIEWATHYAPSRDAFQAVEAMMDYYYRSDAEDRAYYEREGFSHLYRDAMAARA